MKLSLVVLGLSCLLVGISAAPAANKETVARLLRMLVDEEKREVDLELERKQVTFISTQVYSITVYLQKDDSDSMGDPEFYITWNPPSNRPDGTTEGSATTTWNADPMNHKYRITDLEPDTSYTVKVCRQVTGGDPICARERTYKTKPEE